MLNELLSIATSLPARSVPTGGADVRPSGSRKSAGSLAIACSTASTSSRRTCRSTPSGSSRGTSATVRSAKGTNCMYFGTAPPRARLPRYARLHRLAAIVYSHVPGSESPRNCFHFRCACRKVSCTTSCASASLPHMRSASE